MPARCDSIALAGRDQRQVTPLRSPGPQRFIPNQPAQVARERRTRTHGKHAGLLPRCFDQCHAIPSSKHVRIVERLQAGADREKSVRVDGEPGASKPRRRGRAGCHQHRIDLHGLSALQHNGARCHGLGRFAFVQFDATLGERAAETVPHLRIMRCKDLAVRDQYKGEFSLAPALGPRIGQQMRTHGQDQLHATGSAADDRDPARPVRHAATRAQRRKLRQERADRLDGDAVLLRPIDMRQSRRDSDIDGQQVVGDGRPPGEQHTLLPAIDADGLSMDEPCAGHRAQPQQIDVRIALGIEPGNDTGQHPGVRGLQVARHQGQAHARLRLHGERLQDVHMRVPPAEQDDVGVNLPRAHHGRRRSRPVIAAPFPRPSCGVPADRRRTPH